MGTKYVDDYLAFAETQLATTETDFTNIERTQLEDILLRAVDRYSQDRPRYLVKRYNHADFEADQFRFDLPSLWTPEFSTIYAVEMPVDQRVPRFMRKQEYRIIYTPGQADETVQKLSFIYVNPAQSFDVHYTAAHVLTADSSTIADGDFTAVGYLYANHLCIALAGRLRRTKDQTRSLDIPDLRRSKAAEYNDQAKIFFDLYRHLMGLPDKGVVPAVTVRDYDAVPSWGYHYLTHRR